MPQPPVSDEIGAVLVRFFFSGDGPSHSKLSNVFAAAGYGPDDPYSPHTQIPNKEVRVRTVIKAAGRRPARARDLVDGLLMLLRVHGCFDTDGPTSQPNVRSAQKAFARAGWMLTDEGLLSPAGAIDLATGGRDALDEQLNRLRRATEDPGQLLGTAKDLLEAVAKFVLEELGLGVPKNASFDHLWHLARDRLGTLPEQVDPNLPGASNIGPSCRAHGRSRNKSISYATCKALVMAARCPPASARTWHSLSCVRSAALPSTPLPSSTGSEATSVLPTSLATACVHCRCSSVASIWRPTLRAPPVGQANRLVLAERSWTVRGTARSGLERVPED